VELIGALGTGTMLLVATQGGPASGSMTATLIAGAPYLLTARAFGTSNLSGTGVDFGDASYTLDLIFNSGGGGGVPEPGMAALLACAALALAGVRAR
jgi:hypothetical protein